MLFITLSKFKAKPTKKATAEGDELFAKLAREGVKFKAVYWTLGMFDGVAIIEAKDEKAAMKALLPFSDFVSTQTLVAVPREEALKLLE